MTPDPQDWRHWKLCALRTQARLRALMEVIYDRPEGQDYEDDHERTVNAGELIDLLDDTRIDEDLFLDADGEPTRDVDAAVTKTIPSGLKYLKIADTGLR